METNNAFISLKAYYLLRSQWNNKPQSPLPWHLQADIAEGQILLHQQQLSQIKRTLTQTQMQKHKHIYIHSRKPTKHSINRQFQKSAHLLANCRLLRRRDTCCKSSLNLFLDVTLAQWITGDSNSLSWQKYCLPVLLFRGLSFVGIYTVQ